MNDVLTKEKLQEFSPLNRARHVACVAHEGQKRWNGDPYHTHPIRVAGFLSTTVDKIVGYLHDVVEDTPVTLADLRLWGFSDEVVMAVDAVTHRTDDGESYLDYVLRAKENPVGRKVKLADLQDNLSDTDPNTKRTAHRRLREKYLLAQFILEN